MSKNKNETKTVSLKRDSNRSTVVEDSGVEPLTSCMKSKPINITIKYGLSRNSLYIQQKKGFYKNARNQLAN